MIARFLTESIIHTMDKQKLKDCNTFLKNFPEFHSKSSADCWDLASQMNKFSVLSASPVKFVIGKDWVVFGAVCRVEKRVFQSIILCFIQTSDSGVSRWVHNAIDDLTSSFLDNTKENVAFFYRQIELAMKLFSTKKTMLDILNLMQDMRDGKTQWKSEFTKNK